MLAHSVGNSAQALSLTINCKWKLFTWFNTSLIPSPFFSSFSPILPSTCSPPSFLPQACIDENLDMVKFLVENGANVNQQDNEGWTPLHAVASCGYLNIAEWVSFRLFWVFITLSTSSSLEQVHRRLMLWNSYNVLEATLKVEKMCSFF